MIYTSSTQDKRKLFATLTINYYKIGNMFSGSIYYGSIDVKTKTGIKAETSIYIRVQWQKPGTPSNDPSAPAALRFRVEFESALISWYN